MTERPKKPAEVAHSFPPSRPSLSALPDAYWEDEDTGVSPPTLAEPIAASLNLRERALLMLLTGTNAGQVFAIEERETVIGRAREVAVRVDDVGISRKHTRIVRREDGGYFVEDLGSTNGTFLNGQRIARAELTPSDRIQVGPNVVLRFSLIDETEESLARQLYEASTKDPLTRAFNRRYFAERLASEVAFAHRHRARLSVVLFDLDHFKRINDAYGHPIGDVVLKVVSAQVQRLIRAEDVFARYGGEEFVVLVRGIEHANVVLLAERIRRSIEKLAIPCGDEVVKVSVSLGVASLSERAPRPEPGAPRDARAEPADDEEPASQPGAHLVKLADERLYKAKEAGRNRVCAA